MANLNVSVDASLNNTSGGTISVKVTGQSPRIEAEIDAGDNFSVNLKDSAIIAVDVHGSALAIDFSNVGTEVVKLNVRGGGDVSLPVGSAFTHSFTDKTTVKIEG